MIENIYLKWTQRGILLFWAIWFSLVASSDLTNLFQVLKILPENIAFSSNNYNLVVQYFAIYHISSSFPLVSTYFIIVALTVIIALLFWIAVIAFSLRRAYLSLLIGLLQTALFIIAGEIFIQYSIEHSHVERMTLQIVTFILFVLCKNRTESHDKQRKEEAVVIK